MITVKLASLKSVFTNKILLRLVGLWFVSFFSIYNFFPQIFSYLINIFLLSALAIVLFSTIVFFKNVYQYGSVIVSEGSFSGGFLNNKNLLKLVVAWFVCIFTAYVSTPAILPYVMNWLFLLGIILFVFSMMVFFNERKKVIPVCMLLLIGIITLIPPRQIMPYGALLHLQLYKANYQQQVNAVLEAKTLNDKKRACEYGCFVNVGEPNKIVFYYNQEFPTWFAIVYDPLGEEEKLYLYGYNERSGWPFYFPAKRKQHLTGNWYLEKIY